MMFARTLLALATLAAAAPAAAQDAVVTGTVVDARTTRPLTAVRVSIDRSSTFTDTDAQGRFSLTTLPGTYTISFQTIGYALQRQEVTLTSTAPTELRVRLAEGTGGYEEHVAVAGSGRGEADATVGGMVLHGRELLTLRGVTFEDPLRAAHALPSVASTDDFYSEFAVRGSTFRHVGLTVDGMPTRYLMHSIHGVTDGGSVAMINSETLSSVSLLPGSYPQPAGRRLGALLELTTREGNRERFSGRVGASSTSVTGLAEGPLAGRGSWIVSARHSYLDLLVKRIDPDNGFAFGFSDAQSKLVVDLTPQHQVQLLAIAGRAAFAEGPDDIGPNDEARTTGRTFLSALTWRFTPSARFALSQRVYAAGLTFDNRNRAGASLDDGRSTDLAWRADASYMLRPSLLVEFGGDVQRLFARQHRWRALGGATTVSPLNAFNATTAARSVYAQLAASVGTRVHLRPGARMDWWTLTDTAVPSPWLVADVELARGMRVRAGGGVYRQFPELEQAFGIRGNAALRPETAYHTDIGLEQSLGQDTTVQVTWYQRVERDVLWAPGAEPRRGSDGSVLLGRGDAPWINALEGRARGVEIVVRRESAGGISGWAGYAYGRHEYTQTHTNERFAADADQRHAVSLYGSYRLSHRATFGAKFRYGSNYPLTGYIGRQTASPNAPPLFNGAPPLFYALTDTRNTLRLPAYARLDIRADRTFTWANRRVIMFVEVANVLNRENVRNVPYGVDRTGRVFGPTETLLPIVPSGGVAVEF